MCRPPKVRPFLQLSYHTECAYYFVGNSSGKDAFAWFAWYFLHVAWNSIAR